jgi:hypothetical protein
MSPDTGCLGPGILLDTLAEACRARLVAMPSQGGQHNVGSEIRRLILCISCMHRMFGAVRQAPSFRTLTFPSQSYFTMHITSLESPDAGIKKDREAVLYHIKSLSCIPMMNHPPRCKCERSAVKCTGLGEATTVTQCFQSPQCWCRPLSSEIILQPRTD